MKKILLTAIALMAMSMAGNAQTSEDIQQSEKRCAELQKLVEGQPKACGAQKVDKFGASITEAAVLAIENSGKLADLYRRTVGETKDGVTDVEIKKPTVEECVSLSTSIAGEGTMLTEAGKSLEDAGKELKELTSQKSPKAIKQAKGATSIIAYGKDAMAILSEETVAQGKAIKEIIETVKSGKNL